jgi:hypothetical protein
VTIKDQFDVAGLPTTFGIAGWPDRRVERDGRMVAALREAGAIVLGKTNVPPALGAIETDNALFGRTNNPWDLSRTPGGSSGGDAALVAAAGIPLSLGADFGGSLRVPAAWCGVCSIVRRSRDCPSTAHRSAPPPAWRRTGGTVRPHHRRRRPRAARAGRRHRRPSRPASTRRCRGGTRRKPASPGSGSPCCPRSTASPRHRRSGARSRRRRRRCGGRRDVEPWDDRHPTSARRWRSPCGVDRGRWQLAAPDCSTARSPTRSSSRTPRRVTPERGRPPARRDLAATGQQRAARLLRHVRKASARELSDVLGDHLTYADTFMTALDAGRYDLVLCPATPFRRSLTACRSTCPTCSRHRC